jgi:DNA mismatch repair ATPase MutS
VALLEVLITLKKFLNTLQEKGVADVYRPQVEVMQGILNMKELADCLSETSVNKLSYAKTASYDQEFRFGLRDKIKLLLHYIYNLDVYASVAGVSAQMGFTAAQAISPDRNYLELADVYHPLLRNPVKNSIKIDETCNMVFLTGANMAGKSTFMKTFGIAVYLAHMGFPVPASKMVFTVQNGMYTTINLPDNMNMGYSHFYAEVMRVKKVAQSIGSSKNLIVIFDELFRGTNVKDAYDATVAVTEAFAANKNCTFIISTHIIEAGDTLKERCDNINFINLPTIMEGSIPRYTYKIVNGITSDRHGMIIIKNEGILDILRSAQINN